MTVGALVLGVVLIVATKQTGTGIVMVVCAILSGYLAVRGIMRLRHTQ
jgi:hypothetical protein